jgi:hypothetical protein
MMKQVIGFEDKYTITTDGVVMSTPIKSMRGVTDEVVYV